MADHILGLAAEIEREIADRQAQLEGLRKLFPGSFSKNGQAPEHADTSTPAAKVQRKARKKVRTNVIGRPRVSEGYARRTASSGPAQAVLDRADTMHYPPGEITRKAGTAALGLLFSLNSDKWLTSGDLAVMLTRLGWYENYGRASANVAASIHHMEKHNRLIRRAVNKNLVLGAKWEYRLKGVKGPTPTDKTQAVNVRPAAEWTGSPMVETVSTTEQGPEEVNPDTETQAKYYSYLEYLTEVGIASNKFPDYRLGQLMFNVLAEQKPIMAEMIRGRSLDPFHANQKDDKRIENFLTWVERNWDLNDRDLILANPQLRPKE